MEINIERVLHLIALEASRARSKSAQRANEQIKWSEIGEANGLERAAEIIRQEALNADLDAISGKGG